MPGPRPASVRPLDNWLADRLPCHDDVDVVFVGRAGGQASERNDPGLENLPAPVVTAQLAPSERRLVRVRLLSVPRAGLPNECVHSVDPPGRGRGLELGDPPTPRRAGQVVQEAARVDDLERATDRRRAKVLDPGVDVDSEPTGPPHRALHGRRRPVNAEYAESPASEVENVPTPTHAEVY